MGVHLQAEPRLETDVVTGRRGRRTRLLLGIAAVPVVLVALAQVVLPSLAADRVRSKAARYGHVLSVKVSAWPAVELLWGKADSAELRASHMTISPAQMAALLWEARKVDSMTVTADSATLRVPGLPNGLGVEHVTMHKHGSEILATATLAQAQLDSALPNGFRVQPIAAGPEGIRVRASGGLFGANASLGALVKTVGGRLVAEPEGLPFASLATVTLFADPHLRVGSVGMTMVGHKPLAYRLSLAMNLG